MPTVKDQYEGLRGFLQAQTDMMRSHNRARRNGWVCMAEFVLKHGRAWKPCPLPENVRPGRMRECYRNAANLALGFHRNEYIYCEGYAVGIIAVEHAWCVDLQGNVIDPTWTERPQKLSATGQEYFGIAFKSMYLQEALRKQKYFGLIDAWRSNWPLLSIDPEEWRHPINDATNNHH